MLLTVVGVASCYERRGGVRTGGLMADTHATLPVWVRAVCRAARSISVRGSKQSEYYV